MRRTRTPCSTSLPQNASSASRSPETATLRGPLVAARLRRSPHSSRCGWTSSAGRPMDTMLPRPDITRPMAWLRRATTLAASSRLSAPETAAAAISPCEWPMTASGVTP